MGKVFSLNRTHSPDLDSTASYVTQPYVIDGSTYTGTVSTLR